MKSQRISYETEMAIKMGLCSLIRKYYPLRSDEYFRNKLKETIRAFREVRKARRITLEAA
jgi:hypothetical protein